MVKNKWRLIIFSIFITIGLVGCIRVYKFKKERVDIDVTGNQGIIYGQTPPAHKVKTPMRELYGVDIELPTVEEIRQRIKKKQESVSPEEKKPKQEETESKSIEKPSTIKKVEKRKLQVVQPKQQVKKVMPSKVEKGAKVKKVPWTYIVKRGDTLEKIAALPEVYADASLWPEIYKANRDILKTPDSLKEGMTLKIVPIEKRVISKKKSEAKVK